MTLLVCLNGKMPKNSGAFPGLEYGIASCLRVRPLY